MSHRLGKLPAKEIIVRDPIHGFIRLDLFDFVKPLIDSPTFQRLRSLSQTGVSWITYPSATHTRFGHSLGNFEVFHSIYSHLLSLEDVARSEATHLLRLGCACALLHDLGHGPLSHVSERIFRFDHEAISKDLIENSEIAALLDKYAIDRKEVIRILNRTVAGWEGVISQFISSELDSDRLDYLVRDVHFTGVGFGNIDLLRIINMFRINHQEGILKNSAICLQKSRSSLESYVLTRHLMYQDVYLHKTTRGAEQLLMTAFRRIKDLGSSAPKIPEEFEFVLRGDPVTSGDILRLNDNLLLSTVMRWTKADDGILSELCGRFVHRNLLKAVYIPRPNIPEFMEINPKLNNLAEKNGIKPEYFCLFDSCSETPYKPYKVATPEDQGTVTTNIFLYDQEGKPQEISAASDVVKNLGRTTYSDRVYVPQGISEEVRNLFKNA